MVQSRQEAMSLRELLSYSKRKQQKDPLMEYLLNLRERMGRAKTLLTDENYIVLFRHPARGLAHCRHHRFINWFKEFGIPGGRGDRQHADLTKRAWALDARPEFVATV